MKNKTVPEIRHKNIDDEWKLIKLSDLINFSNGINASKESYGRGRKMISVMDILSEERIEYKKIRNSVEVKESIESKNKVENGDLIFVRSSEVRNEVGWAKAYLQEQYALHSGFTIRGKKQNEYDAKFIECSLNFRNRHQIESKAGGSTRYNVGQEILKNVEIYIPSLKEQLLISTLIQNIESKINLHQQELAALKQTKQGFFQKMFPKEGKNTPEIRFEGFKEEWKEVLLGKITESYSGGTPSAGNKMYYNGIIPFIRSAEINSFTTELFLTEEGLKNSSAKLVNEGTILYALYGATSGEVGISKIKGAINQAILAIQPKEEYDSQYVYQYLKKSKKHIVNSYLQGGQGNLSGAIIKKISILVPPNKIESKKIGEFFKQLDGVIELKEQEIEALKQTKKGFLQKMFV